MIIMEKCTYILRVFEMWDAMDIWGKKCSFPRFLGRFYY